MNKGEWSSCVNYVAGDAVTADGKVYEALQQNAGKYPETNPTYWTYRGLFFGIVPPHNELDGLQGTSETDYYHLNENQAAALLNADEPSAANPVLTKKSMPALGRAVKDFEEIAMPPGMSIIYGAYFDEAEKKLVVVGDDAMASLDAVTRTWTPHAVPAGPWRAVTKFSGNYVAVGKNAAMAGTLDAMASVPMPSGDWRSLAGGDSRVVAVADGRVAGSPDGLSGWGAKNVSKGYGDSVAYSAREGRFFSVGAAGCKSALDSASWGDAWDDEPIPAGTWRSVLCFEDWTIAVSGVEAHKKWDEDEWASRPMPVGGWEDAAAGRGFVLTAGNGIAATAQTPALQYASKDIPNNIYTCAVYGASAFWVLGSVVLTALTVDTAGALAAADGLNADNPPASRNELLAAKEEAEAALEDFKNEANAALDELEKITTWRRID
jgi:hypothetical protein